MVQPVDVAELRKRLGWSQEFLAEHLGIAPASVARWERGVQKPSRETASRLHKLWLSTTNKSKGKSRRRHAAAREDGGATRIQRIGGASYKTKVFRLGPPPGAGLGEEPGEEVQVLNVAPPPLAAAPRVFPALPQGEEETPRRSRDLSYPPPSHAGEQPYLEERREPPRPKSKRRLWGIPVRMGIAVAVIFVLLIGTLSAARASSVGLSPNLPELLTRVFPRLELFVTDVEKDLIAIGKAYREPGPKPTPNTGPQQSLEDLLKSVSDVNEQLGPEASDRGLFAEIIKVFRQNRDEAWQRATSGR